MAWQLQDAKNRFSEVVQKANTIGPQIVTVGGKPTAVVVSMAEFERLNGKAPSLMDHILPDPAWPDDVVEEINLRSKSRRRSVEF